MKKPIPADAYVMIIGAMKAGTSSLYNYVSGHPEICPCITKEPQFFASRHQSFPVKTYRELFPKYDPKKHKIALEASTSYAKFPGESGVPERIKEYGLEPKFVYLIRNPFQRIESHFNYMRNSVTWKHNYLDNHLIRLSDYYLQLEQYLKIWPKERIKVMDFDLLKNDPARALDEFYAFTGLSAWYPKKYKAENVTRINPPILNKLERDHQKLMSAIPGRIRYFAYDIVRKRFPVEKIRLTEDQKAQIHEELAPGMEKLRDEFGVDVGKWKFDA